MIFKILILKFTTGAVMKSISIIEMLLQMSSNVTLIASNLGARDVIVHFEIVFILFFYLPFCRLSILKPGGDPFEMRFFKISARSNNNFLRPYFSSHLISEFRALSITHTKKTCQNATVLLSRSENFMTMARINFG